MRLPIRLYKVMNGIDPSDPNKKVTMVVRSKTSAEEAVKLMTDAVVRRKLAPDYSANYFIETVDGVVELAVATVSEAEAEGFEVIYAVRNETGQVVARKIGTTVIDITPAP